MNVGQINSIEHTFNHSYSSPLPILRAALPFVMQIIATCYSQGEMSWIICRFATWCRHPAITCFAAGIDARGEGKWRLNCFFPCFLCQEKCKQYNSPATGVIRFRAKLWYPLIPSFPSYQAPSTSKHALHSEPIVVYIALIPQWRKETGRKPLSALPRESTGTFLGAELVRK